MVLDGVDRWTRGLGAILAAFLLLAGAATARAQHGWRVHDDLFSICFPTEEEGWACGRFGTILHTSDGGLHWTAQESGTTFTLSSIYFPDVKNGWAVGNKGTILHTSDGGKTWELQESPVDYYHMDLYFLDSERGFIVSERTHILATEDGGRHWEVRFSDEDYILKSISFCDPLNAWVVGEFGYTYHTRDGGKTWEKQAGFYELDYETGALRGDDFLFDVVALDPKTAWAVGIQGTVRVTTDGGKTWRKVAANLPKVQLYTIASDGKGGLVIGGSGICVASSDGGRTWHDAELVPSIEYGWLYDITRRSPGLLAACGDEGVIYLKGSGKVWKRVDYDLSP